MQRTDATKSKDTSLDALKPHIEDMIKAMAEKHPDFEGAVSSPEWKALEKVMTGGDSVENIFAENMKKYLDEKEQELNKLENEEKVSAPCQKEMQEVINVLVTRAKEFATNKEIVERIVLTKLRCQIIFLRSELNLIDSLDERAKRFTQVVKDLNRELTDKFSEYKLNPSRILIKYLLEVGKVALRCFEHHEVALASVQSIFEKESDSIKLFMDLLSQSEREQLEGGDYKNMRNIFEKIQSNNTVSTMLSQLSEEDKLALENHVFIESQNDLVKSLDAQIDLITKENAQPTIKKVNLYLRLLKILEQSKAIYMNSEPVFLRKVQIDLLCLEAFLAIPDYKKQHKKEFLLFMDKFEREFGLFQRANQLNAFSVREHYFKTMSKLVKLFIQDLDVVGRLFNSIRRDMEKFQSEMKSLEEEKPEDTDAGQYMQMLQPVLDEMQGMHSAVVSKEVFTRAGSLIDAIDHDYGSLEDEFGWYVTKQAEALLLAASTCEDSKKIEKLEQVKQLYMDFVKKNKINTVYKCEKIRDHLVSLLAKSKLSSFPSNSQQKRAEFFIELADYVSTDYDPGVKKQGLYTKYQIYLALGIADKEKNLDCDAYLKKAIECRAKLNIRLAQSTSLDKQIERSYQALSTYQKAYQKKQHAVQENVATKDACSTERKLSKAAQKKARAKEKAKVKKQKSQGERELQQRLQQELALKKQEELEKQSSDSTNETTIKVAALPVVPMRDPAPDFVSQTPKELPKKAEKKLEEKPKVVLQKKSEPADSAPPAQVISSRASSYARVVQSLPPKAIVGAAPAAVQSALVGSQPKREDMQHHQPKSSTIRNIDPRDVEIEKLKQQLVSKDELNIELKKTVSTMGEKIHELQSLGDAKEEQLASSNANIVILQEALKTAWDKVEELKGQLTYKDQWKILADEREKQIAKLSDKLTASQEAIIIQQQQLQELQQVAHQFQLQQQQQQQQMLFQLQTQQQPVYGASGAGVMSQQNYPVGSWNPGLYASRPRAAAATPIVETKTTSKAPHFRKT